MSTGELTAQGVGEADLPPFSERGPASTRTVVAFGFWLFLLSDIVLFAALFAAYAVLSRATNGGPGGLQLFDRGHTLIETACLLASSFTCGLLALATERHSRVAAFAWGAITFVLGFAFVSLEVAEFVGLAARGATPQRSAFLSAFYTLVGTHGLHVTAGLLWLALLLAQVNKLGFRPIMARRLLCFSLFWHALDLVWIGVFTIVYLGAK